MDVPVMIGVNAGLIAVFGGGLLLLMVAVWWSWAGDGVEWPRERWPGVARVAAIVGWCLFAGGIFLQVAAYLTEVEVARFWEVRR